VPNKLDGVVKSPHYCVAVIFQDLNILRVCPTILKNHYALYLELFTTPSVDRFVTFYEAIKLSARMGVRALLRVAFDRVYS